MEDKKPLPQPLPASAKHRISKPLSLSGGEPGFRAATLCVFSTLMMFKQRGTVLWSPEWMGNLWDESSFQNRVLRAATTHSWPNIWAKTGQTAGVGCVGIGVVLPFSKIALVCSLQVPAFEFQQRWPRHASAGKTTCNDMSGTSGIARGIRLVFGVRVGLAWRWGCLVPCIPTGRQWVPKAEQASWPLSSWEAHHHFVVPRERDSYRILFFRLSKGGKHSGKTSDWLNLVTWPPWVRIHYVEKFNRTLWFERACIRRKLF